MRKNLLLLVAFLMGLSGNIFAQNGPYPPAAGQEGSTAIPVNSDQFVCWATGIQLTRGYQNIANPPAKVSFGYPALGLGVAEGGSMEVVSLGDAGEAILTFDRPIVNGPGFDFAVFENSFDDYFLELAFVEVSSDGVNFFRFPAVSLSSETEQIGTFGQVDATMIHNLAGKYRQGYGTPFDLDDVADNAGLDVNNIRFVKLIDVIGCIQDEYATYDSQGHKVNDPWPTEFNSSGFDLDGVGVINAGAPYEISNFNELSLAPDSYWDGSDGTGGFTSGIVRYVNNYDALYYSWSGFAYSNMRDDTTGGYTNQFSAITRGGMEADDEGGTNYAVAYVATDWMNDFSAIPVEANFVNPAKEDVAYVVNGFFVTNATYAYLSMRDGDGFAKKFGGDSGNDPDWLTLNVFGIDINGNPTDTVVFYLADFRFDDNSQDYIVDNWRWVDLASLGEVTGLRMFLESTDAGAYGMNTPAYFCIDNMYVNVGQNEAIRDVENNNAISVYPNPTSGKFYISTDTYSTVDVYNVNGQIVSHFDTDGRNCIDISDLSTGMYFVRIASDNGVVTKKLIKK